MLPTAFFVVFVVFSASNIPSMLLPMMQPHVQVLCH
jgi:hypothetical protein